jgi:hypothetical protein
MQKTNWADPDDDESDSDAEDDDVEGDEQEHSIEFVNGPNSTLLKSGHQRFFHDIRKPE